MAQLFLHDTGTMAFPNLTVAGSVDVVDAAIFANRLETVSDLKVEYSRGAFLSNFKALKSTTGNVYAGNGSIANGLFRVWIPGPNHTRSGDLNITKNSGLSEISFNGLTDVKRLYVMDNPDSTVPGDFSRLTAADYIYVNGRMNNTFPLFPHLSTVAEARIEPWNADFDCSSLVKMRDTGKIGVLFCNGTNGINGLEASQSGLSTTASVGIGVGIGALVIIAALVWLAAYYRCKLRGLRRESHNSGRDDPKEIVHGVIKPTGARLGDTHIREAGAIAHNHTVQLEQSNTRSTPPDLSAVPTTTKMGDPYTLLGCYVDQSPNRTLPTTAYQRMPTNRATVCHALCNAPEYRATLFGLEYGAECYCGAGDPASFQKAASDAECDRPCPANASEMCGGDWRLSLYRIRDTTLDPSPAVTAAPPTGPSSSAGSGSGDDQHTDSAGGKQNLTGAKSPGSVWRRSSSWRSWPGW
ncbi:hypothetical protein PG997_010190 [Apiospora hydei]|uniref:WSC domain-containing protein n=1 Tax=Apiospora hydei TaxID=1337664 RepID=A0ABR1VWC0_9PEZI